MAKYIHQPGMEDTIRIVIALRNTGREITEAMKNSGFLQNTAQNIEVVGIYLAGLSHLMQLLKQGNMMKKGCFVSVPDGIDASTTFIAQEQRL